MNKRKYDWCYFADGNKKKITNWYQSGDDILFFVEGKVYLYKKDNFRFEELFARTMHELIYPMLPRGGFYIHRSHTSYYSPDCYNKDNYDEWTIANIEKIELRK